MNPRQMRRRQRQAQKKERQIALKHIRRSMENRMEQTFWNHELCFARKCIVQHGDGRKQYAVEVTHANQAGEQPFYLDNQDGSGWRKVTVGRGSPGWPHTSIPDSVKVVAYAKEV